MSFNGRQGSLHIKLRVHNHPISQVDRAMYRHDTLDVTQRRDTQDHFPLMFPRHHLQRQQLQDISDDAAMRQSCQFLIHRHSEVSYNAPLRIGELSISLPELQKYHSLHKGMRYSTAPPPGTNSALAEALGSSRRSASH